MGNTFKTGNYVNGIFQDASNNVGIGAAPSGTYKLEVTGTAKVSSTLLVSGAATFSSSATIGAGTQAINSDAELTLREGVAFVGLDFQSARTSGNLGGIRFFNTSSTTDAIAQLLIEVDGKLAFYNNNNATPRLTIASTGAATFSSTISAGVITGDSNSTGVPSIVAKVGGGGNSGTYGFGNSSAYRIRGGSDYGKLIFDAGTADQMTLTSGGNVGIGTSTPNSKLDIGTTSPRIRFWNGGVATTSLRLGGIYASNAYASDTAASSSSIDLYTSPDAWYQGMITFSTNGSDSTNSNATERMRITSGGYTKATNSGSYYSSASGLFHEFLQSTGNQDSMWIYNTASSGYGLTINMPNTAGNGTNYFLRALNSTSSYFLYSNGSSTFSSDRNLKKNIETTRDGYLEDLMNLRVVKYNWNTQKDGEAKELGLIAQEVAEIFPSLVVDQSIPKTREIKQDDGSIVEEQYEVIQKGLKVSVLPFMLLKAIQEQQAMITSLQQQINELKNK